GPMCGARPGSRSTARRRGVPTTPRAGHADTTSTRMIERNPMNLPPVVSPTEWQSARDALLAKEKDASRARDALAAERRRLPMVRLEKDYTFDGPEGKATLLDLFEGRRQLLLYHF